MNKIAHIFSWILSPVLIPTYAVFVALWVTLLSFLPVDARWGVVAMTWVITCAIPVVAILLLYKFKVISAPGLNQQKERYIPYVVTALCYLGCGLYMYRAHAPMWLVMFMVGGAAAAFVSCFINIWWKISAHGAAMGGLLALMFRILVDGLNVIDIWPLISITILLTGILGSARKVLNCHTFWQVIAGVANGFFWVFLLT